MEVFLEAAAFASTDNVTGVTENIMLGKLAPVGTAAFDLVCPASALGSSLGCSASEVQQFVPKTKKVNSIFYEDSVQAKRVNTDARLSLINGALIVAPMDLDSDADSKELEERTLSALDEFMSDYRPSSPVWIKVEGTYCPSSPIYQ
jgi:hypothetical protein